MLTNRGSGFRGTDIHVVVPGVVCFQHDTAVREDASPVFEDGGGESGAAAKVSADVGVFDRGVAGVCGDVCGVDEVERL